MNIGIPRPSRYGWGLFLPIGLLCIIGVLTIQAIYGPENSHTLAPQAEKQIKCIIVSLVGMAAALSIGYWRLGRFSYPLFGLCVGLLALLTLDRWVDLPFVPVRNNSRRWFEYKSVQLQPSELMKIVYVLGLAWYLRYRSNYRKLSGLIAPFVLTLVPMALILMEPDLGTVLIFLPVLFAMLYAAGAKGKHLGVIIVLGILCGPIFWCKIADYQRLRITGVLLQSQRIRAYLKEQPTYLTTRLTRWDWLRPSRSEADEWSNELTNWESYSGFQLVRSKAAIGSGGPFGKGWKKGIFVDYDFLPEKQNDFIVAMIAHQWGLVGVVVVLVCFAFVVCIGFDIATLTNDPFGRLVAVGMSTLIGVQTLTNICMTVGLGPITGLTLPFVSYGGSSLLSSFLCVGLLISVARRRPILMAKPPFEFDQETEE